MRAKRQWVKVFAVMGLMLFAAGVGAAQEKRKLVNGPDPSYPEIAKVAKLSGVVKIEVIVGADGTIKETKVIGGHPVLVESVKEALKKWKYAPSGSDTVLNLEFSFHP